MNKEDEVKITNFLKEHTAMVPREKMAASVHLINELRRMVELEGDAAIFAIWVFGAAMDQIGIVPTRLKSMGDNVKRIIS